jgi:hypothetical protein
MSHQNREARVDDARVDEMIRELKAGRDAVTRPWDEAIAALQLLRTHDRAVLLTPATPRSTRIDRDSSEHPRGIEAVRRVLQDSADEMDVRQITEELLRRGWVPQSSDPVNATSSAASRLVKHNRNVTRRRNASGGYLYRYENPASTFVRSNRDAGERTTPDAQAANVYAMPSAEGESPDGSGPEDDLIDIKGEVMT